MNFNSDIKEFKEGFKKMFRDFFNPQTNKSQRTNMWTFSRLVIAFCVPIMMIIGKAASSSLIYLIAGLVTLGGEFTDFMDGRSARKHNSVSSFGKYLDIVSDKVFSLMIGISLSILNPIFLISLLGEAVIAFTNIGYKMKYNYLKSDSIKIGKIKQWPLSITFGLGFLSLFLPQLALITKIMLAITTAMQVGVLFSYIKHHQKQIKEYESVNPISNDNDLIITANEDKTQELTRKEEYIRLRNVLNEINKLNVSSEIDYKDKVKKRKK